MPTFLQPRLEPDIAEMVRTQSKLNRRSLVGEANFALRAYYFGPIAKRPRPIPRKK